ncbi:hypothetical protein HYR82_03405 [Candidatus Peregrinibacteria bacterium]|nr:hypothetical protein [Candidatus Peregrinibacteria bacterium]
MQLSSRSRSGVTFIEVLLFLAIVSIVGVIILPLLFASTENRLLQESISLVEHNGTLILQSLAQNTHHAERVIGPGMGEQGKVLALQSASGAMNPTIFALSGGSFIIVQHTNQQIISASQVAVQNFTVRNTSTSSTRQSVLVSFTVSRTLRLEAPRTYSQGFEALFTLYPVDKTVGNQCGVTPGCIDSGHYSWQIFDAGVCQNASTTLNCL